LVLDEVMREMEEVCRNNPPHEALAILIDRAFESRQEFVDDVEPEGIRGLSLPNLGRILNGHVSLRRRHARAMLGACARKLVRDRAGEDLQVGREVVEPAMRALNLGPDSEAPASPRMRSPEGDPRQRESPLRTLDEIRNYQEKVLRGVPKTEVQVVMVAVEPPYVALQSDLLGYIEEQVRVGVNYLVILRDDAAHGGVEKAKDHALLLQRAVPADDTNQGKGEPGKILWISGVALEKLASDSARHGRHWERLAVHLLGKLPQNAVLFKPRTDPKRFAPYGHAFVDAYSTEPNGKEYYYGWYYLPQKRIGKVALLLDRYWDELEGLTGKTYEGALEKARQFLDRANDLPEES
jgi:hypothetical protein